MAEYLFVYGTLHPERAPAEIADVVGRFAAPRRGTVLGRLHDLGPYPAVRLDVERPTAVPGTVFLLPDDPEVLKRLDAYEGFLPGDPPASLFLRQRVEAVLEDGESIVCWIYTYSHPLPSV
jgi:gamma-glutamylcyclotransferase (GGCT)/AIG2-like uncharacterized protein YtfP